MNHPNEDFGFSFEGETPLSKEEKRDLELLTAKVADLQRRLQEAEKLVLPLLYNLMKNPEKPYIKWENREKVIQEQIEKILAITRS